MCASGYRIMAIIRGFQPLMRVRSSLPAPSKAGRNNIIMIYLIALPEKEYRSQVLKVLPSSGKLVLA